MIHPRISLVSADYVATQRGVSVERVYESVDGGFGDDSYLWVFNVAANVNVKRELRFWAKEINTPELTRTLPLDAVVRQIVPRRDAVPGQFCGLRNWEVGELLRVSRATLMELRSELEATPRDGGIWVPRTALEHFFVRRWVYGESRTSKTPLQGKLL